MCSGIAKWVDSSDTTLGTPPLGTVTFNALASGFTSNEFSTRFVNDGGNPTGKPELTLFFADSVDENNLAFFQGAIFASTIFVSDENEPVGDAVDLTEDSHEGVCANATCTGPPCCAHAGN